MPAHTTTKHTVVVKTTTIPLRRETTQERIRRLDRTSTYNNKKLQQLYKTLEVICRRVQQKYKRLEEKHGLLEQQCEKLQQQLQMHQETLFDNTIDRILPLSIFPQEW